MEEYPLTISDRICGELEEKNRLLSEYVRDREDAGDKEGVIQVRIHQLALCKVLVNVHNRTPFILVQGHTNLGESYLANKYYEQSLDHLTAALKLNGSLFNQIEETKTFHTHILTLLGKRNICMLLLKAGEYEEALEECLELEELDRNLHGENSLQFAKNLKVIATISMMVNKREQATDYFHRAVAVFKRFKNTKKTIKEIKDKLEKIASDQQASSPGGLDDSGSARSAKSD